MEYRIISFVITDLPSQEIKVQFMSSFSPTTSASVKPNTALQTLQDLLQAFKQNQGLSLSSVFPSFGTRTETVSSQPEESFFNGRLAFQEVGEIETEGRR